MVFSALAPSLSKLLATTQSFAKFELCSAGSIKQITIGLSEKQRPSTPSTVENHCGYCLLQQHVPFIPTLSLNWNITPFIVGRLSIGSGDSTIFNRFVQDAYHSRAPPVFS
jgi:hypothetical protein